MTNGKNSDETINIPMMYINEFFSFDQHFQIFLGAESHDINKYTRMTTLMECLLFIAKWSGNLASDFEKELIHFIKAIKDDDIDENCCEHNCLSKIECQFRKFTDERLSDKEHYKSAGIPNWTHYRFEVLPSSIGTKARKEIENMIIRAYATLFSNTKNVKSIKISDYKLINRKIKN